MVGLIPVAIWWAVRDGRQTRIARLLVVGSRRSSCSSRSPGQKRIWYPSDCCGRGRADRRHARRGHRRWAGSATAGPLLRGRCNGGVAARDRVQRRCGFTSDGSFSLWRDAGRCGGRRWRPRRCRVALRRVSSAVVAMVTASSSSLEIVCARYPTSSDTSQSAVLRHHSIARDQRRNRRLVSVALPSMVFYLNRPVMEAWSRITCARYSIRAATCISSWRRPVTHGPCRWRTRILARREMFDVKAKNFLDGSELPQFVLISNRE